MERETQSRVLTDVPKTYAPVLIRNVRPEKESLKVSKQEFEKSGVMEAITESPEGHFPTPMHTEHDNCEQQSQNAYGNNRDHHD